MEPNLSAKEVIMQIQELENRGNSLSKKQVKQTHPELMRSALYYYPSWQHALDVSSIS
ncbi:hypothetical protein M1K46_24510 [Fictibacillus sp. WQ 8-8]|uniref:Transposase n=1 Tax=Fictibacillus terranigra TaxID=3058424 RepID=A0ABT8E5A1_9BACL|nr:hypothetical protein [Fictibacillus sp. CENA-BCM004]MCQ6268740.1 hypothetical protein [Fictibacillus sp. WQ 8-8]MDN4073054.1 hypothetical protein [Fictibacillus sp. CENA-BCM004]SFD52735.1 hypothetical protein SAMN05428981_101774 [Bacillus sp. OV194]